MIGPGKYDEAATKAREATGAKGVLLFVLEGEHGSGFSAQLPGLALAIIPRVLREVADQIEYDQQHRQ